MKKNWWKESVIYQIYPRSFKDSNGDGIGDLKGVIQKLDYLKKLGINVIWLSPIYKSPNDDNGYDISNYRDIMDEFGTLADFDLLLSEAHKREIKIVMDLVVNHTSDEHKFFVESRKSVDNKYRNYYIWKKGKGNQPPNNWQSFFSGSAWQYDKTTDMYYLHLFSKKQPDLNWENVNVRNSVFSMMRWWLDRGIDGFRMDVINMISKDQRFPDSTAPDKSPNQFVVDGPKVHEYIQEMNRKVLSKYDIMTVGETANVDIKNALKFVGEDRHELNMVFQFEHVDLGAGEDGKWSNLPFKLTQLKNILTKWQNEMEKGGWNSLYWDNHDQPRAVSRFGNDKEYWEKSAKMLGTCIHMMKGTPYVYQGEEIGMTNVYFNSIDDYKDIETINAYNELVNVKKRNPEKVMEGIHARSRDNARTPMQWNDGTNAGFTDGTPWIKVNPNYKKINVKNEIDDPDSIFNYYRKLIQIRRENPIVVYGKYDLILKNDEQIFAYTRTFENKKLLVICNFTKDNPIFNLPDNIKYSKVNRLISNYEIEDDSINRFKLKPYEARVYMFEEQ